ncbi:MAG TPA: acyltransferase [Puia sp.]|nr:acyltransferase [Puia sp.]
MPRFSSLTGLRAIAAILVYCFHFRKAWVGSLPLVFTGVLKEMHIGVSIFFVLSGFLIAYTYSDKPLGSRKDYWYYLLVRFARIFPVYLVILTARYWNEGFPSAKETFLNYTLLKGFSDKLNLTGISQSWSLTVELTFYCLAPWLYSIIAASRRRSLIWLSALFGLACLTGWILHVTGYNGDSFLYNPQFVLDATFFGRSFEFYAGIRLALIIKARSAGKEEAGWAAARGIRYTCCGAAGIIAASCLMGYFGPHYYSPGTNTVAGILVRNLLLPPCIALFIYGLITERNRFQQLLGSRLFVLLGNASYIFYLLHIGIGYSLLSRIRWIPDYDFTLLWIASILGYLLFERPVYTLLRKLIAWALTRSAKRSRSVQFLFGMPRSFDPPNRDQPDAADYQRQDQQEISPFLDNEPH